MKSEKIIETKLIPIPAFWHSPTTFSLNVYCRRRYARAHNRMRRFSLAINMQRNAATFTALVALFDFRITWKFISSQCQSNLCDSSIFLQMPKCQLTRSVSSTTTVTLYWPLAVGSGECETKRFCCAILINQNYSVGLVVPGQGELPPAFGNRKVCAQSLKSFHHTVPIVGDMRTHPTKHCRARHALSSLFRANLFRRWPTQNSVKCSPIDFCCIWSLLCICFILLVLHAKCRKTTGVDRWISPQVDIQQCMEYGMRTKVSTIYFHLIALVIRKRSPQLEMSPICVHSVNFKKAAWNMEFIFCGIDGNK